MQPTRGVTSLEAHESILAAARPSFRDRPEETARDAFECAQAIFGSCEGESFGWSRRQKRERIFDDQVAILNRFAGQWEPPGMPIGSGGEHDVRYADHAAYVFKLTNNNLLLMSLSRSM